MRRLRLFVLWVRLGVGLLTAVQLAWYGLGPIAGGDEFDNPSDWNLPASASASSTTVIPQFSQQSTTVNLAGGASINFDFNIDVNPLFDMLVRADQPLTVTIFSRIASTDTYTQLDQVIAVLGDSLFHSVLTGRRIPGSQVRIQLGNPAANPATTVLVAQVHSRSS